jgi:hypothetical protein
MKRNKAMKFVSAMLGALFLVTPLLANAQDLEVWEGALAGDTLEQVLTRFPEAQAVDERLGPDFAPQIAVTLDGIILHDLAFRAEFELQGDRLVKVRLYNEGKLNKRQAKALCADFKADLEESLGAPVSQLERRSLFFKDETSDYVSGPLRVSLTCTRDGFDDRQLLLDYRVPAAFDRAKAPYGIRAGMTLAELSDTLPEKLMAEESTAPEGVSRIYDVTLTGPVDPRSPDNAILKLRVSNQIGVCAVRATSVLPAGFTDEGIAAQSWVMPSINIYGAPDDYEDRMTDVSTPPIIMPGFMMAGRKGNPQLIRRWNSSADDPLPGSVQSIESITAFIENEERDQITVERATYRFNNAEACGALEGW